MIQLKIGEIVFPLEVTATKDPKDQTVSTLAELLELGVYFNTPSDFQAQQIQVSVFQSWLEDNGYNLPENLSNVMSMTVISINHIGIGLSGEFEFSFSTNFDPTLTTKLTQGIISIDDFGLAIAHSKTSQPN